MADVFISYARSTMACAEALARIVEADGYSVWYDARLPAHRAYADVIEEQLDAAKAAIIIWSHEAVRSQWVRSEADRARMRGTLVQLRIDDCPLPMPFDQIECPVVEQWNGQRDVPALSAVLASLSELLGGRPAQAASEQRVPARKARPEEAQLLIDAAAKCLQSGQPQEHANAIPLLLEATTIAPEDADAWGLLAVLYAARAFEVAPHERSPMKARARSAIKTARSLDPDELRSRCAEVILLRPHRNWDQKEREARAILDRAPDQPLALYSLAMTLAQVGRWNEAAEFANRINRKRFLLPAVEEFTVYALWGAGDIVRAERAGEQAARRFPTHAGLFEARLAILTHSGRARDAIAMIEGARNGVCPAANLEAASATARAFQGSLESGEAISRNLEAVEDGSTGALTCALRCAALGGFDECFELLDGYYRGTGPWSSLAPSGGDEDRLTMHLFMPPMEKVWRDARFKSLTEAIGLASYWEQNGSRPEYLG